MLKYGEGAAEAYFINKEAVVSENTPYHSLWELSVLFFFMSWFGQLTCCYLSGDDLDG